MRNALFALAFLPTATIAQTYMGEVVAVDGDTLSMTGARIRLVGIDAPELAQICTRQEGQFPCGEAAKAALASLVDGVTAQCVQKGIDEHGRLLATCRAKGSDLGEIMIARGFAIASKDAPPLYKAAEAAAKARGIDLWASQFVPPAEYRAEHPEIYLEKPQQPELHGSPRPVISSRSTVVYRNCNEVRAAGRAPLHRGQPGYRAEMDGDNDGLACEATRH